MLGAIKQKGLNRIAKKNIQYQRISKMFLRNIYFEKLQRFLPQFMASDYLSGIYKLVIMPTLLKLPILITVIFAIFQNKYFLKTFCLFVDIVYFFLLSYLGPFV
jgi:hypothetical protein